MEEYVTVIVFILYFIASLIKKKRDSRPNKDSEDDDMSLKSVFDKIKKSYEFKKEEDKKNDQYYEEEESEVITDQVTEDYVSDLENESLSDTVHEPEKESSNTEKEVPKTLVKVSNPRAAQINFKQFDLKKGIILHEILGPCLAKRKHRRVQ